jgi:hypothetical protein
VYRCALQYALKARCRLCVVTVDGYEVAELIINVVQDVAAQPLEVDAAGAQHGHRVLIFSKREQQMFERGIFVATLVGISESPMQRLFEIA